MKKKIFYLLFFFMTNLYADAFTKIIQDLAVQIACTGQYNATMNGGTWIDDPVDFYTPQLMAQRFTEMAGNKTEYQTFYGICYNYAKYTYFDIKNYKSFYEERGMKHNQFYIVGVDDNTRELTLLDPGTSTDYTMVKNGEFLKEYRKEKIYSHKDPSGKRVTHHAWVWIQRNDGVWFWIDPTFTDNMGYVVYGYVNQNTKEEVQLKPDRTFCLNYPSYLENLPEEPYASPLSTAETQYTPADNYTPSIDYTPFCDYDLISYMDIYLGVGLIKSFDSSQNYTNRAFIDGFEVSMGIGKSQYINNFFSTIFIDSLFSEVNWEKRTSWILGLDLGYSLFGILEPYAGAGLGMKIINEEKGLEYKVACGLRLNFDYFTIGGEVSYGTILGPTYSLTISIGNSSICQMANEY